jgi:flagellar hook-associated protein 1 FlgK
VSGLLRFKNTDLAEGRNLLGRLTVAVTTSMNDQHKLGLDLDGNVGGNLFTPVVFGNSNIMQPSPPATLNTGSAVLGMNVTDATKLVASDYELNFTSATSGSIVRRSDGVTTNFAAIPVTIDGLTLNVSSGTANAGDRFLLKPYSSAAGVVNTEFSTPRALAVASPIAGLMGTGNTGSLQLGSLLARNNPATNVPVTITFTGTNSYTRSDVAGTFAYNSGAAIEGSVPATTPLSQWSLTLQGIPKAGDSFTVETQPAAYRNLNGGNANALMGLRDVAMFDGAALTDGYASLMSQIGIRVQSAKYSADVSSNIAANVEKDRTAVSGVNLDEEAGKLLQYQQAYQASAKMIQIASSIFDTLIQSLR